MQEWKVPVPFGSLQQNRCPGTNLNPAGREKQPWHRRSQQRREGAPSETWLGISNFTLAEQSQTYHVHLLLLAGGSLLEDWRCSSAATPTSDRNISATFGAPFLPGYVSPEPEPPAPPSQPSEPQLLRRHGGETRLVVQGLLCDCNSTEPLHFTMNANVATFDLHGTIATLYASIFFLI